jgi:hypothetical protein
MHPTNTETKIVNMSLSPLYQTTIQLFWMADVSHHYYNWACKLRHFSTYIFIVTKNKKKTKKKKESSFLAFLKRQQSAAYIT